MLESTGVAQMAGIIAGAQITLSGPGRYKLMLKQLIKKKVYEALDEDLRYGDVTTELVVSPLARGTGSIYAREAGVIAGLPLAEQVFHTLDESLDCNRLVDEGEHVDAGRAVMRISGPLRSLLSGERTALNFLQRLSGIATLTADWVKALEVSGPADRHQENLAGAEGPGSMPSPWAAD